MTTKARTWFATAAEFRQCCGDAQSQARSEWDQQFAADMMLRANEHGLDTFLSPGQLRHLCRIADWDQPQQVKP